MRRATKIARKGSFEASFAIDRLTLDYEDRFRRRKRFTAEGGTDVLLDLPETAMLHDGDGLVLEGGGYIAVRAAAEKLIEVKARTPGLLARLAWHLGNRHLPIHIGEDRILLRDDHVIVDMLKGLGAETRAVEEAFDPEGGAYNQRNHDSYSLAGAHHHHGHGHHDHDHHDHDHEHGPDCGHDHHGHDHKH